jgi:2-amino-4-hydroxy-6-hydroxymethyldihydropteridine diphosphokinase
MLMDIGDLDEALIVALGSNLPGADLGSRDVLERALERFTEHGLRVKASSRWWRSAAWPDPREPAYLNGVALVETRLSAEQTLDALLRMETEFGRVRGDANAARTLDLDLIAYGRLVQEGPPALPHPRARERLFVMGPLAELAPSWRDPVSGETAAALARAVTVGNDARPLDDWRGFPI